MPTSFDKSLQNLADNLGETWKATDNMPVSDDFLSNPDEDSTLLIKRESRVRILLTAADTSGRRICFKIYRFPSRLRWRTLFSAARVKREFENLVAAGEAGVPIIEPVTWFEERHLGMLEFNAIATVYLPKKDLAQVLMELPSTEPRRLELIRAAGKLLAHMHHSGQVWVTALPRNILVEDELSPKLLAFDMPYGCSFDHSVEGSAPAAYDLHLFIKDGLNQKSFDTDEARAFLDAYCDNHGSSCEALMHRLQKRSRLSHFMGRIYVRSLANAKASLRRLMH